MPGSPPNLTSLFKEAVSELRGDRLTSTIKDQFTHVIALGKAAGTMALGLQSRVSEGGFVVGPENPVARFLHRTGGHPIVNEDSLTAGQDLIEWIGNLPKNAKVAALLSGGASAMVESLKDNSTIQDMAELTRQSFKNGWDIRQLNEKRAALSQIKGGGLARLLGQRLSAVYLISDVPIGEERWVGSGPFWTPETAHLHHVLATRKTAAEAIQARLKAIGLHCPEPTEMSGDVEDFAVDTLIPLIAKLQPGEARVCYGELTLEVKGQGTGGRCQHLGLLLAPHLAESKEISFLAAGTDGRDGPTDYAGVAITPQAAQTLNLDEWSEAVSHQDSSQWLSERGLTIPRFESGTNLNDIVIIAR